MSLIDDLIEKRTNKNNPSIMGIPQNILVKEFYRDLQTLKQSEKVVEIKIIKAVESRPGESDKFRDIYGQYQCKCKNILYNDMNYCPGCGAKIKWID